MTPERLNDPALPRRVLLVGWDAADWQIARPLVEAGLMPTFARLLARGAQGNLATTRPILSPILWNTIATGRRPDAHGVLGFTEPDPDGRGVRPTASTSRRVKALWNILTQCGMRSKVVGWYASHPAEPILGEMVSNQIEFGAGEPVGAPLRAGAVHPAALAEELAACRVHPSELDASAVLPFIPDAARVATRGGNRIGRLLDMLAQTATVQAMATRLLAARDWDLGAVYFEGIDRFGHEFMEFHPPKMDAVSDEDFEAYRHCMTGIYRFHDMMLEPLLALAGDDTAVIVISDHGYWNDHRRPDPRRGRSGPVDWHRPLGLFAAAGPGIRADARLHGGSILDIAPTALALLGLPAARDMPGRVLAEVLEPTRVPERIASWESVPGEAGMHPPDLRIDPIEAQEALAQLVALGYIEAPGEDDERTRRDTIASNRMQLAQSHADAHEYAQAIAVVDALDARFRESVLVRLLRAQCLHGIRDFAGMRAEIDALGGEDALGLPATLLLASARLAEGEPQDAAGILAAYASRADDAGAGEDLPTLSARCALALARPAEAEALLLPIASRDAENAEVLAMLAECRLALGDPEGTLSYGMRSAAIRMTNPRVHILIGRALLLIGEPTEALVALEAARAQAPQAREAEDGAREAREAIGAEGASGG